VAPRPPEQQFWTLGPLVRHWIEAHCVIPDGERMGDPFILTPEMAAFVDAFYAVDATTKTFVFNRGGQFIRPQKYGKGPFSAALICAEAAGPVLPVWDGDKLKGGTSWVTPWIQVTAVSEDQTANVFRALLPMIQLSDSLDMEIADTGLTRINLPGGGYIEPVTASARSRLGQRITFSVQDETHSWVQSNGGWQLADNQRRNLAGMGGRFLETTNAFDPVENSVAQRTFESKAPGTLIDDADPPAGSIRNKRERRKVMQAVYGDSLKEFGGWVDLNRIDAEVEALLEHDPAQAERFFLNRKLASEGAAFDFEAWLKKARKRKAPPKGTAVVIGVDGALNDDALAVVACEVKTGFVWPLGIWERPADAGPDYEHPKHEVDGVITEAFDTYMVWRLYADDQWIEALIERWQNRYGEKRVLVWRTNRPRQIAWAVRNFEQAIHSAKGELTHSGDETLNRHVQNSRKRKLTVQDDHERQMHTLAKPAHHSPLKIDGAMAAVLAWEARGDAIAARVVSTVEAQPLPPEPQPERWQPGTALPATALMVPAESGPMGEFS
jgi:hypothetical protein